MKLDFLLPLFSESEIKCIAGSLNVSYLEKDESKTIVYENLKYLKECVTYTDNKTILKYAVSYWGAFINSAFRDRLDALIERHDDWEEIVEKQFQTYEGSQFSATDSAIFIAARLVYEQIEGPVDGPTPPIMQAIGWGSDKLFYEYLELLDSPEKMHWNVIIRLKNECGIEIEPEDIGYELTDFLYAEVLKDEILDSTNRLLQLGVDKGAVGVIICCSINLLANGYNYVYAIFQKEFGNGFVDKINELYRIETLVETLGELFY